MMNSFDSSINQLLKSTTPNHRGSFVVVLLLMLFLTIQLLLLSPLQATTTNYNSPTLTHLRIEQDNSSPANNNSNNSEDPSYEYPIWIPWVLCGSLFFIIFTISTVVICLFASKKERGLIYMIISIFGVSIVAFCLFVIPVDIFNVSHTFDPRENSLAIKIIYYSCYLILLIFGSVIIPFAYFWYEENPRLGDQDDDTDDKYSLTTSSKATTRNECGWRLFHTMKYTIFTIVAGILIIIIGLVLSAVSGRANDKHDITDWLRQLVDVEHFGDRAIRFIIGSLAVIGCIGFNIYTAYGLSALPIGFMKRKHITYKDEDSVNSRVDEIDEEIDLLQKKYKMKGTSMSRTDQKKYDQLRDEKTELTNVSIRIERSKKSFIAKIEPCIYPFKAFLGFILLVIVLFLMVSLIINLIYRTVKSKCGISCGFVTEENCNFNPLDLLLTYSSIIFPIDYIILGFIIILFLLASMTALSTIGLRILCIKLYKLKLRSTLPQGLLTSCIFLMFIMLCTSFMLPSFAPIYTTFGSQRFQDPVTREWKQCALSAFNNTNMNTTLWSVEIVSIPSLHQEDSREFLLLENNTNSGNFTNSTRPCFMSELSQNVNSMSVGIPVFSIIFYFENWLFILCFVIGFFVSIFRKAPSFEEEDTYDQDEEIMKRPLRGRSYKSYANHSDSDSTRSLQSYRAIN
ncbi:hypothetical protein C9374_005764 [Naegleria lovaniensis]|uniref:Uncharacterized protein n=1 Tax=Naegleria lovaniensis TaxID=51637 RepID=A0AA88GP93_NAELO|nr:uncharacterized protein C9374_005764 [Naegleria lovaniensis]KAG2381972.1 hypothetical protein C9374_005764 [Naegleria lovaniensis]